MRPNELRTKRRLNKAPPNFMRRVYLSRFEKANCSSSLSFACQYLCLYQESHARTTMIRDKCSQVCDTT